MRKKVDFICIGAQKAGTTWLYNRLNELSEVTPTPIKELHYFDRELKYPSYSFLAESSLFKRVFNLRFFRHVLVKYFKAIKENPSKIAWLTRYFFSNYNDEWYLSLFKKLKGISGEITPAYSTLDEEGVAKMYQLIPDTKIILLLRNPIDRAWSHYRFSTRNISKKEVDEILKSNIYNFIDTEAQLLRTDYIRTIDTFLKFYPKEQFMIAFYDSIKENPTQMLEEIVSFIGGDSSKVVTECDVKSMDYVSPFLRIPEETLLFLKEKYNPMINEMNDRYGSYCQLWKWQLENNPSKDTPIKPTIRLSDV